jgi:hypothetical protein
MSELRNCRAAGSTRNVLPVIGIQPVLRAAGGTLLNHGTVDVEEEAVSVVGPGLQLLDRNQGTLFGPVGAVGRQALRWQG